MFVLRGLAHGVLFLVFLCVVMFVPMLFLAALGLNPNHTSTVALWVVLMIVSIIALCPLANALDPVRRSEDRRDVTEKLGGLSVDYRAYWEEVLASVKGILFGTALGVSVVVTLAMWIFIVMGVAGLLLFGVRQLHLF